MNAFTAKEYTCFYARVLDTDLPLAVDVVCDMVTGSLIRDEDVDVERGVILEEIAMNEDDPADCVHDQFAQAMFGDTPLGRPVLGTVDSIKALTARPHPRLLPAALRPEHLVVAAAGNVDHAKVVRLVREAFERPAPCRTPTPRPIAPRDGRRADPHRRPRRAARPQDRAGQRRPRHARAWPAPTSAASPSACSTRRSAAACRPGCSRRSGRSAAWPTPSTRTPPATPTAACSASTPAACPRRSTRCWRSAATSSTKVAEHGITDEELGRGKGQLRGSHGARPGGHRLADEPDRQERAVLGRAAVGRRHARPDRRGHPRRRPRGRPRRPGTAPVAGGHRPVQDKQAARLHDAVA